MASQEYKRILNEQGMDDLQRFYRDAEQADTLMAKQEDFLANEDLGDSLDSEKALIKKHEDFEKSLEAEEQKIQAFDEFATKLIDDVAQRRARLLERRSALREKSAKRRALLKDSYNFQEWMREMEKHKRWLDEILNQPESP